MMKVSDAFTPKRNAMYDVCVIVLCYNRLAYTKRCLNSLLTWSPERLAIVIVDNGSTDGSRAWLRSWAEGMDNVKLVMNKRNEMPAGGNRIGLRHAMPARAYLLCDNDGLFTGHEWHTVGLAVLETEGIGLVNMRKSRWRQDGKLRRCPVGEAAGQRYWHTEMVASFSLLNEAVRQSIVKHLRGQWIGVRIGELTTASGQMPVALHDGLIEDQSENDLDNPEHMAQHRELWKKKGRIRTFNRIINQLKMEKGKIYKDPKRAAGSQSERPTFNVRPSGRIDVGGYQKYSMERNAQWGWCLLNPIAKKYIELNNIMGLLNFRQERPSVIDVGASNGLVSVCAAMSGSQVYAIDHDRECVKVINDMAKHTKLNIVGVEASFGEGWKLKTRMEADVVFALALIHWVWSCTATYGSFSAILEVLVKMARKVLVVEWIDVDDKAIRKFGHLDHNKDVHQEAYTRANFVKALKKVGVIEWVVSHCETRHIYVVRLFKDTVALPHDPQPTTAEVEVRPARSAGNFCSDITIDRAAGTVTKVMNWRRDPKLNGELWEREKFWLRRLKNTGIVPELKAADPERNSITMSYEGEPLTPANRPKDYHRQMMHIMLTLQQHGCYYNDWKPGNILVKDGMVTLIDFGWCPMVVQDFTCGGVADSSLTEKPFGNIWLLPM
jgi:glycosyltransferase involved in cell wall biosynthesis